MRDSDHELMRRCRDGDAAAFERLVRRWEGPVTRILARLADMRPEPLNGEVQDLAQEVFLRVLSACDRYSDRHPFSTWIYQIALNVARDAARRRRKWWRLERTPRPTTPPESPAARAARDELEQGIRAALASLPAKLREPLVLKHFGGLTFDEIATLVREPASTIKSRVQSALTQLKAELKRRGIDKCE